MSQNTVMSIRIDKEIKEKADALFDELGLNISTAFKLFLLQSIREQRIPFEIALRDDFYSASNQRRLQTSIARHSPAKLIEKSMNELEAMENA